MIYALEFLVDGGVRIDVEKLRASEVFATLRNHEVILSGINLNLARAIVKYVTKHPEKYPIAVRSQMVKAVSVIEHAAMAGYTDCYRVKYKPSSYLGGRIYGQQWKDRLFGGMINYQGLVAFPRIFKDVLFQYGGYVDLDMSACHPTILYVLGERCRKKGMPVTTDGVRRYVQDNAGFVREFIEHHTAPDCKEPLTRDNVKLLVTARMFEGGFEGWLKRLRDDHCPNGMPKPQQWIKEDTIYNWAPCYKQFDADLTSIANALCDTNADYSAHLEEVRRTKEEHRIKKKGGKRDTCVNPRARVLSYLMQTIETVINSTFADILTKYGIINNNYDWGYDGLTGRLTSPEKLDWLKEHLTELNRELHERTGFYDPETGIGPTYAIKEFKCGPEGQEILAAFNNDPTQTANPTPFLLDEDPEVALQRAGGNEYINLAEYYDNILYCEDMGLEEEEAAKYAYKEAKKVFEKHVCYDNTHHVVRQINRKPDVKLTRKHGEEEEDVSALGEEWAVEDPMKLRMYVEDNSNMCVRYQYIVPAKTQTIRGRELIVPSEIKTGSFEMPKQWKMDPSRRIVHGGGYFGPWTHAQKHRKGIRNYSPVMDLSNDWRPFRYDYTAWYRTNPTNETLSGCMLIFTLWYLLMGEECGGWLWMTKYLAHGIQFPNVSAGAMLIFKSLPGCGKGTFETGFTNIVGDHASACTDKHDQLLGRFNGLGEFATFFFLEEASNAFTMEQEGTLKSFVTDCKRTVERKGKDAKTTRRYLRLFRFMNTALSTMRMFTEEDRRSVVSECSSRFLDANSRHHKAFYAAVDRLSVREDVLITMMWLLQRIDLTGWAPTDLYRSAYHYQLIRQNVHPIVTFMNSFMTWAESNFDKDVCPDCDLISEYSKGDNLKVNAAKKICCVKPMVLFDAWGRHCARKKIENFEPNTYMKMGPRLLEEFPGCTKLNASRFTEIDMVKLKTKLDEKQKGKKGTQTVPTSIGPIKFRLTPEERARMNPDVLKRIENLHEFINGLSNVLTQYGNAREDPPLEHLFAYCGMDVEIPESTPVGSKRSANAMDEDDEGGSDIDSE